MPRPRSAIRQGRNRSPTGCLHPPAPSGSPASRAGFGALFQPAVQLGEVGLVHWTGRFGLDAVEQIAPELDAIPIAPDQLAHVLARAAVAFGADPVIHEFLEL